MNKITHLVGLILALGLLPMSACKDDKEAPQPTEQTTPTYRQLALELSAEVTAQPFDISGEGRSLDYSLGTENAPSFPKLSAIAEDTPVLGIVRSSNSDQPINYLHLRLAKKPGASGGRTYRLIQAPPESRLTFNFDASKPLGQLSMMLIVGGQWSERDKRVHFTSRVVPIEVADGQRQVKGLDVPYLTGWIDLKAEREGDDYIVMRQDASIKLRPQGLLLDIKIDNDSGGNPAYLEPYRNLVMHSFTIRSNAYGGSGGTHSMSRL